ncbi:MAG: hypothetical protein ACYTG6_07955, partial [Planctomycetota bacterium]|jgi:hypothetical protein
MAAVTATGGASLFTYREAARKKGLGLVPIFQSPPVAVIVIYTLGILGSSIAAGLAGSWWHGVVVFIGAYLLAFLMIHLFRERWQPLSLFLTIGGLAVQSIHYVGS